MGYMDFFRKKNSGEVAKDRLKLLLISDRANCSPEIMEAIKNDIIKVVSGYTFEQFNQNSDAIKDTILEDMQNLFGKDYVIGVNFSKLTAQ